MICGPSYLCPQESYAGVTLRSLACVVLCGLTVLVAGPVVSLGWLAHRARVLWFALFLVATVAGASHVRLAWDASATPGCSYVLYAERGTNSVRVNVGEQLAVEIEDLPAGVWSFWATARLDGVESDSSNVIHAEVPAAPGTMRTVYVQYGQTITNWADVGFFRLRIP